MLSSVTDGYKCYYRTILDEDKIVIGNGKKEDHYLVSPSLNSIFLADEYIKGMNYYLLYSEEEISLYKMAKLTGDKVYVFKKLYLDDILDILSTEDWVLEYRESNNNMTVNSSVYCNSFIRSHSTNSISAITDGRSIAQCTDTSSSAVSTGSNSLLYTTGSHSIAAALDEESVSISTGERSIACSTTNYGSCRAGGKGSIAISVGIGSTLAEANNSSSIAVSYCTNAKMKIDEDDDEYFTNYNNLAKGVLGSWLILVEIDRNENILDVKTVKVDGQTIKANTYYTLQDGKIIEQVISEE